MNEQMTLHYENDLHMNLVFETFRLRLPVSLSVYESLASGVLILEICSLNVPLNRAWALPTTATDYSFFGFCG